MLVEDDKSLREIYGIRMVAEGYDIVSAGDGEEALALAVRERPDLILSDVMMPKISGFDMLDILRATPETKDIKVIMMTALSSEAQRARGEALGANRYLVKSQVGIEDVVRTVKEVLEGKEETPMAATPTHSIPSPMQTETPQQQAHQTQPQPQTSTNVAGYQPPAPQQPTISYEPNAQPDYAQPPTPPAVS